MRCPRAQVERLLRDCCELALARVRKQLLQFLSLEGLEVDDRTFAITCLSRPRAKGSSGAPGLSSGMFDAALATHSAKTFHRAEAVRALLESEITELLAEIVLPVSDTCTYNEPYDEMDCASSVSRASRNELLSTMTMRLAALKCME